MNFVQHTMGATRESILEIFEAEGKDCSRVPGSVTVQLNSAAVGRLYAGASDVGTAPANAGRYCDPDGMMTFVAIEPNEIDARQLYLIGTSGDIVHITAG